MREKRLAIIAFVLLFGLVVGAAVSSGEGVKSDVWKDSNSGLTWQVTPTGGTMAWKAAKSHCANLSLGGFSDWRLPTISELRSLIRGCPATQKGGACGVTDSCLAYKSCKNYACSGCTGEGGPGPGGAYWPPELQGEVTRFWSSSAFSDVGNMVWVVDFHSGRVVGNGRSSVDFGGTVRCVH